MPEIFEPAYHSFLAIFDSTKFKNNLSNELNDAISKRRIARAAKIMAPFVLRRKKDQGKKTNLLVRDDIPPKIQFVEKCMATESQKKLYRVLIFNKKDILFESKKDLDDEKNQSSGLTNVLMRLRKASNHPLLHRRLYTLEILEEMSKQIINV
jgi:SWI/SNF-related matrix-associated actin-dependent regulator 1 of chromatin subfamily A